MRCIIAGPRGFTSTIDVYAAIQMSGFRHEITTVVCGGAKGVDDIGDKWAAEEGLPVEYYVIKDSRDPNGLADTLDRLRCKRPLPTPTPRLVIKILPYENVTIAADWGTQGKSAGPIRNYIMSLNADALIAVRAQGHSPGTTNMIEQATRRVLRVFVWEPANAPR